MSRYLFFVAHVDDAEISCGGTIIKLIEQGHFVRVLSMTSIYDGVDLSHEFESSMKILGVTDHHATVFKTRQLNQHVNEIADLAKELTIGFDFVFTHSTEDRHDDHRTVAEQVRRVVNGNLITFITPQNGEDDSNLFLELSEEHLEKKIKAIACYESQKERLYMLPRSVNANAIVNGLRCGKRYAEAFRILRIVE